MAGTHSSIQRYLQSLGSDTSRNSRITLWLIILLGLGLRWYWLAAGDAYHYLAINDEITAYEFAMRFLAGESSAYYLGQPDFAGGKAPGPWFTVFWVATYLLGGKSLYGALLIVVLLTTAAIPLVYRLARKFLDNHYALLAALCFACAPWPVYYAVTLWNPTPLVILGGFLLLFLWQTVTINNTRAIVGVCVMLALIPHFHMIGLFYIPAVLLLLLSMPVKMNIRWFVAGILAGVVLYLPYLVGDALHDWANLRAIITSEGEAENFSASALKILTAPPTVLSNLPSRWAGPEFAQQLAFGDHYFGSGVLLILLNLISILFGVFIVYAFAAKFIRLFRQYRFSLKRAFAEQPATIFLGVMLFVPLLLFFFTGHNYATRYTIIIFPLLFILFVLQTQKLLQTRARRLFIGLISLLLLSNIYISVSFSHYTGTLLAKGETFMPSFQNMETIRMELASRIDGVPVLDLGPAAQHLSELDRTVLAALPAYVNIHYRYLASVAGQSKVPLLLATDAAGIPQENIIYHDKGIVVSRP